MLSLCPLKRRIARPSSKVAVRERGWRHPLLVCRFLRRRSRSAASKPAGAYAPAVYYVLTDSVIAAASELAAAAGSLARPLPGRPATAPGHATTPTFAGVVRVLNRRLRRLSVLHRRTQIRDDRREAVLHRAQLALQRADLAQCGIDGLDGLLRVGHRQHVDVGQRTGWPDRVRAAPSRQRFATA